MSSKSLGLSFGRSASGGAGTHVGNNYRRYKLGITMQSVLFLVVSFYQFHISFLVVRLCTIFKLLSSFITPSLIYTDFNCVSLFDVITPSLIYTDFNCVSLFDVISTTHSSKRFYADLMNSSAKEKLL